MQGLPHLSDLMRGGLIFALLGFPTGAQEIPVRQETLGQWHYLHDVGVMQFSNTQVPPVAMLFGPERDRLAVLLPGSYLVAEFKAGHFYDLHFPATLMPTSLACDPKDGRLFCLGEKKDVTDSNWTVRWMTELDSRGWSRPEKTPIEPCDRLTFDRQDRLWALGPSGSLACRGREEWNRYSYNDDPKLGYAPIRMTANAAGDPVFFANWELWRDKEISHLRGTLTYHNANFVHDAGAETTTLVQAEVEKEAAQAAVSAEPSAGYLIQKEVGSLRARTRIDFMGDTIVCMGADGLAWTSPKDAAAKPLSIDDEWQPVDHVACPPTSDQARGIMWVVRRAPSRYVKITAEKTEEFPITPEPKLSGTDLTIDVDVCGCPWVMSGHGSGGGPVSVLVGDQAKGYPDLATALLAEGEALPVGPIFPFAVKAPSGLIAMGGGDFGDLKVVERGKMMTFDAVEIDPEEQYEIPRIGHGFNPLRGGEPWVDREGILHTVVVGRGFAYRDGRWSPSAASEAKDGAVTAPGQEDYAGLGADESPVEPFASARTVFRGFHFYRKEGGHERQVDFGLNPLARYPFWNGMIPAVLDPQGKIWIGPADSYRNDMVWRVGPKK